MTFAQPPKPPTPYTLNNVGSWYSQPSNGAKPYHDAAASYGWNPRHKNFEANYKRQMLFSRMPAVMQSAQFANDWAPMRASAAGRAVRALDPTNNQKKLDRMRSNWLDEARVGMAQLTPQLLEAGASDAAIQGAMANAQNMAVRQGNDADFTMNSPEYTAEAFRRMMAMIDAGAMDPSTQMAAGMVGGAEYFKPPPGPSVGGVLSGLAGNALNTWLNSPSGPFSRGGRTV